MSAPALTSLTLHQASRRLELTFADGQRFEISLELLRVMSPSAEVRGHGAGQEILQTGKREVGVLRIDPVGHYGIQPVFDDGHQTGIYTWEYLYRLGRDQDQLWQDYQDRLAKAGRDRDEPMPSKPSKTPKPGGCAS